MCLFSNYLMPFRTILEQYTALVKTRGYSKFKRNTFYIIDDSDTSINVLSVSLGILYTSVILGRKCQIILNKI